MLNNIHHIDASIFLELFIKPSKKRNSWVKECKDYLQYKIGKRYKGKISLLALGEIVKVIGSIEKDNSWETEKERADILFNFLMILKQKDIQFWSPQFGCMSKALELKNDFQFEPADLLHLSCASEDEECSIFVTIEEKFLNNPILEKKIGIRVKHPSTL